MDRAPASRISPAHEARAALAASSASAELALLDRCGARLADVLRGAADPLPLLFPRGDLASVERIYESGPVARVFNTLAAPCRRGGRRRAAAGPARCACWRSAPAPAPPRPPCCPRCRPARTEYVFTDLSPLFLARAAEQFRGAPFLTCRSLDIERDPAAQGFEAGGFDLIVAANVLHATRDLRRTLGHVRGLLAPDGLLVLLEGTTPYRWVDLTFGLTEGWWRFADADAAAVLSAARSGSLEALLQDEGFVDARAVPGEAPRGARPVAARPCSSRAPRAWPPPSTGWSSPTGAASAGAWPRGCARAASAVSSSPPAPPTARAAQDEWVVRPEHPEGFHRLRRRETVARRRARRRAA